MVRPSYVLGGRAMEIVYSDKDLHRYINTAVEVRARHPRVSEETWPDPLRSCQSCQGCLTPAVAAVHALHLTS